MTAPPNPCPTHSGRAPTGCRHVVEGHELLDAALGSANASMHWVARGIVGIDDAADVVQEVIGRLWIAPPSFDATRSGCHSYLTMITRSAAIDHLRRETARRAREERADRRELRTVPGEVSDVLRREECARLASAIGGLEGNERQLILIAFFDHLTYRQLATRLGIPEGTVKTRIRSALRKLRFELRDLSLSSPTQPS